jgi:23S rRNA (cytidine1920-2'-O)/16S rRNA (cytidine1409-2'-O)-methyltransferase
MMLPARKRADVLLVERGLFESRARAQAAIEAGLVTANGKAVAKPSETIAADAVLQAQAAHPFVSRGGVKLAGALEQYPIDIEGHVCLDVGASTGGFTEVLLANGASLVFAIDVGREQLHASLRSHPKVVSMEETDIRDFEGKRLPIRPDVVGIDVSFISLKAVLPVALSLAASPMRLLALIKPQFEAARKHSKRGVIRNATVHQQICDDVAGFAASLGCSDIQVFPSSITGGDGNIEFFIGAPWLSASSSTTSATLATVSRLPASTTSMYRTRSGAKLSKFRPCRVIPTGGACSRSSTQVRNG